MLVVLSSGLYLPVRSLLFTVSFYLYYFVSGYCKVYSYLKFYYSICDLFVSIYLGIRLYTHSVGSGSSSIKTCLSGLCHNWV
jgi:hypothetical protein